MQYLVDQGLIRAGDVAEHPDRNKVYSCLGGMVDPVIDLSNRTLLRDGDVLVLCTDGLWGPIPSDEIATWLTSTPILKAAPEMMREAERRARPGRRQPLRDRRALGPETRARRAVDDDHRNAAARRVRDAARLDAFAAGPQRRASATCPTTRSSARSTRSRRRSGATGARRSDFGVSFAPLAGRAEGANRQR